MAFDIDKFLIEKIQEAKKYSKTFGLSNFDAEDISQEVAAEFFIKFSENRVDTSKSIDGYWSNIQKWRILDKMRRNNSRNNLFFNANEENDMDSLPFEKEIDQIEVIKGKLRLAVLKLKRTKSFQKKFGAKRDIQLFEEFVLNGKSAEEIKEELNFKTLDSVYVQKHRAIKRLSKIIKNTMLLK